VVELRDDLNIVFNNFKKFQIYWKSGKGRLSYDHTNNEIFESIAITARKTIIAVIVTMSLKRFSAV